MTLEELAERNLQSEYSRLERSPIPEESRKKIRGFVSDLKVEKDIGRYREYYYLTRLRKIAEMLKEKFTDPTEGDLKDLIRSLPSMNIYINNRETNRKYTMRTVQDYKHAMKMFYRWTGKPGIVEWIRLSNGKEKRRPEDIITQKEIEKLAGKARNQRDRALFYALYDSGCRIGELLTLKNKDVSFDNYGAILSVFGKTGYRQVRVVGNSISYIREWQSAHPDRNNPDAWFFCGLADSIRGRQLTHADVYKALRQSAARAGINRRIHPHLFRHTRATLLASKVTEAPLELQMGWVHGSKMTRTYVHLSGRDQDRAILKAYGIELEGEEKIETELPSKCPRCGEPNDNAGRFCWKCGMILDKGLTEKKLRDEAKDIEKTLIRSSVVDESTKKLIEGFPEEFKDVILETVIKQILDSPELRKRFREEYAQGNG